MAYERIDICADCEEMSDYPKSVSILSFCNSCSCNLSAKTRSPNSVCPLNKWPVNKKEE